MCRHIFQVSSGIFIRWKTFKTYVVPFLELFLPFQIQKGIEKASELTKAQHTCLSRIVGLSTRNNSGKLRKVLAELSIKGKAIRLAKRFETSTRNIGTFMQKVLEQEATSRSAESRIRTRSGNELTHMSRIEKCIKDSFIYKLRQAAELPSEDRDYKKVQFMAAKRYASKWKQKIKRMIVHRSKNDNRNRRGKRKARSSTAASKRRRNIGLNHI